MKTTLSIKGMHCSSCAMSIDDELEELAGVKRAKTSYAKARSEVEFDPEQVSPERMVEAVKGAGYAASVGPIRG